MMIHDITALAGKYKARKRIGRGRGSGMGKTSGRGHKGAGSRSGYSRKPAFEGGQMPYFRRIPKRGFTNANFMTQFRIVNLRSIVTHPAFAKGGDVNKQSLEESGLIPTGDDPIKILGDLGTEQSLSIKLNIDVARVSTAARKHVEDAGGTVNEQGSRRDRVRGIDRNTDSEDPTKLTKKRKRWLKRQKAKS
jgi:large subunit ribosomal protein L15